MLVWCIVSIVSMHISAYSYYSSPPSKYLIQPFIVFLLYVISLSLVFLVQIHFVKTSSIFAENITNVFCELLDGSKNYAIVIKVTRVRQILSKSKPQQTTTFPHFFSRRQKTSCASNQSCTILKYVSILYRFHYFKKNEQIDAAFSVLN